MSIQSLERFVQVMNDWFDKHPELVNDEHNVKVMSEWVKKHYLVAGEPVVDDLALDLTLIALGPQLHYYAGEDVQRQIAQVSGQATALLEEKQAKERAEEAERRKTALRQKLEQDQRNRTPGVASAMSGAADAIRQQQEEAGKAVKDAQRSARHDAFITELRAANDFMVCTPGGLIRYGATNDGRVERKAALAKKYPEFRSEIK